MECDLTGRGALSRTLLLCAVMLAVTLGVMLYVTHGFQAYTSETARRVAISAQPRAIPALPLQLEDGSYTSFSALQGRWLLVNFIYTRCMTYCLAQGSEFARLQRQLAAPIAAGKVQLLSISFDPEHDHPAALSRHLHTLGKRGTGWVAARPLDASGLQVLKRTFGLVTVADGLGGYIHNAAIAVVNPAGKLVKILDWDDLQGAAQVWVS